MIADREEMRKMLENAAVAEFIGANAKDRAEALDILCSKISKLQVMRDKLQSLDKAIPAAKAPFEAVKANDRCNCEQCKRDRLGDEAIL